MNLASRSTRTWSPAPSLLAVLLAAGCEGPRDQVYTASPYGLSFVQPAGWEVAAQSDMPLTVRFESRASPGSFTVTVRPDPDLGFAPASRYLNVFAERKKDDDPSFRISGLSETNLNGVAGVLFKATSGNNTGHGFFFIRNDAEYCLVGLMPATASGDNPMFRGVLRSFSVSPPRTEGAPPRPDAIMAGGDYAGAIAYGRDLLRTRDVNVANYELAMAQFRAVLRATGGMTNKPAAYDEAFRLMTIAKSFQNEAFLEYRLRLERSIGLRKRGEALAAADYIFSLISDRDDPRYRYAMAMYSKAAALPPGD